MRTHTKRHFIIKGVIFGLVAGTAFTFATMLLWNWLLPMLFGVTTITFWQALGILVLAKILFGGGGHGSHFHKYNREKYWKERFKEKIDFAKMHHGDFKRADLEE